MTRTGGGGGSRSPSGGRFSIAPLVILFVLLSVVPLGLLAYFSSNLAGDAVGEEVETRVRATAGNTAALVEVEMQSLAEIVASYAQRPALHESMGGGERPAYDARKIVHHLTQLRRSHPGIYTTFAADPRGRLLEIVPATPAIVGKDFSFRDWYKGVTASGRPYVSEAYETQARGTPLVVAAAAPVRDQNGKRLGILVAAYSVQHIQEFSDDLAVAQEVKLKITDHRGVLLAATGDPVEGLSSVRRDRRVAAALGGESGVVELDTPEGRQLSAYAPVPGVGWTVSASVRADTAFAAVGKLRSTVIGIAALLGAVLVGGLIFLARVLVARRRAEDQMTRQATLNRAVLDASLDGIRLVDSNGDTILANAAMDRMADDLLKLPPDGTIYDRTDALAERTTDPDGYRAAMREIRSDPSYEGFHDYAFADTGRAVHRYTAPVRDPEGDLIGRIFVIREVTAEREAEQLKTELMATVSHELRTPLASILGFAELLAERDPDPETRKRYLATIHGEAKRLTELINDFLDLQRMEEGRFRLALEAFDVGEVVREGADVFAGQSEDHSLRVDVPAEPLRVTGERDRIRQVLANLVSNAIKYSPAGGEVDVSASPQNGVVRVEIRDRGLGIPPEQQDKIFTKFFRVDTSDTREIGGSGLGLALCREIVEAHGGRIGFDSRPGEGSTFWFELPAAHRGHSESTDYVLVIEDDPSVAALIAEYLTEDGHAVEIAATGEDGLALAWDNPPLAVCLDIELPGELDGWDVLAALKDNVTTVGVPVVVCTAGNGKDRAMTLGVADFLTKPFSSTALREAVARIVPEGSGHVLVVDDEENVRNLVIETLGSNGFTFHEADDGITALDAVSRRRPDAIVLDLMMPRLDGFSVLERLQQNAETRSIPVIVLTARKLSAEERSTLSRRAVSLLEKSDYSAAELRRLVRSAVGSDVGAPARP